jgi:glycosyltransferase involved in cell wall biosynthesis
MNAQADARKHIALVGPAYPYRGGIAQFQQALSAGLEARGHRVSVVTFSRQYPDLLFPGKTQYEPDAREDDARAPRLIDTLSPPSWYRTARHLARLEPDAVVFQYWMPFFAPAYGVIARRVRKRRIKPLVVVHNALPHEKRPGDALLSRFFLKACAGFITLSASVGRDLESLDVAGPIRQVGHPVYDTYGESIPAPEARQRLGVPRDVPVLLFFGFIRRYKGLHVLLESLPAVLKQHPDVHVLVAGEFYDDEAPYHATIARHGLGARVHLHTRYIPHEEVSRYFSAADVVIQPYTSATQSGVVQIAYHFEKPVIVTDVGGLAEVVPDGRAGFVVPPEDPGALAQAIIRFIREDEAENMRAGVREEKQKYSWDRLYEALEGLM